MAKKKTPTVSKKKAKDNQPPQGDAIRFVNRAGEELKEGQKVVYEVDADGTAIVEKLVEGSLNTECLIPKGSDTQTRCNEELSDEALLDVMQNAPDEKRQIDITGASRSSLNIELPVGDCENKALLYEPDSGYSEPVEQERIVKEEQVKLLTEMFRGASQEVRQQFADNLAGGELLALEEVAKVAKEKPYRELIFGDKTPSILLFRSWLDNMCGKKLRNEKKDFYAKATNYFKKRLGAALIYKDEKTGKEHECGIKTNKATPSTTRFRVYKTEHGRSELKSITAFPRLFVRAK